jgi:hypothetical protein
MRRNGAVDCARIRAGIKDSLISATWRQSPLPCPGKSKGSTLARLAEPD